MKKLTMERPTHILHDGLAYNPMPTKEKNAILKKKLFQLGTDLQEACNEGTVLNCTFFNVWGDSSRCEVLESPT